MSLHVSVTSLCCLMFEKFCYPFLEVSHGRKTSPDLTLRCLQLFCPPTSICSASASQDGTTAPTMIYTWTTYIQVLYIWVTHLLIFLISRFFSCGFSCFFLCDTQTGTEVRPEPDYDRVLLRVMHLYEEGEDPELSKPVTINLKVRIQKRQKKASTCRCHTVPCKSIHSSWTFKYLFHVTTTKLCLFSQDFPWQTLFLWSGCFEGLGGSKRPGGAFSYRDLEYHKSAKVEVENCRFFWEK